MLDESKLATYCWAEAINTACYTQNISIVNQAQGKTPYQLMKNKKPTLNFLYVFGCKYFVLRNQGENLGKFEVRQMKLYLLDMQPLGHIESTILG